MPPSTTKLDQQGYSVREIAAVSPMHSRATIGRRLQKTREEAATHPNALTRGRNRVTCSSQDLPRNRRVLPAQHRNPSFSPIAGENALTGWTERPSLRPGWSLGAPLAEQSLLCAGTVESIKPRI